VQVHPLSAVPEEEGLNKEQLSSHTRGRCTNPTKTTKSASQDPSSLKQPKVTASPTKNNKPKSRGVSPSKTIRSRRSSATVSRSNSSSGDESIGIGDSQNAPPSRMMKPRVSLKGDEISARMKKRSSSTNGDGGNGTRMRHRSSFSSGDGSGHPKRQGRSSSMHSSISELNFSISDIDSSGIFGKSSSRPGAVSQFLRRTHRKLKNDIEEMQDKISDLRNKITSVQAEVAFL